MFHYPDFFQVGISESGNHDNRDYEDDWAEKWQGLLEKTPGGKTNYDSQANQNFARNLKGHLMLAHGTMDNNVPPYNTLLSGSGTDQGEQRFRPGAISESGAQLRSGCELHAAQAMGLFRPLAAGHRSAEGIRISICSGRPAKRGRVVRTGNLGF